MMAAFRRPAGTHDAAGPLPGGRRGASGGGGADGGALRPARGRGDPGGPDFDLDVPPDGYAWWYVDGISDDGAQPSRSSASSARSSRPGTAGRGRRNPHNHCCINVATYGPRRPLHDDRPGRDRASPDPRPASRSGRARMHWDGDRARPSTSTSAPSPPLVPASAARIRVHPAAMTGVELPLHPDGTHVWRPFAPTSRNRGRPRPPRLAVDRPRLFRRQLRDPRAGGRFLLLDLGALPTRAGATCLYDATRRDGSTLSRRDPLRRGGPARHAFEAPPPAPLRRSRWALSARDARRPGHHARVRSSRCSMRRSTAAPPSDTTIDGETSVGVHEALDLDRFATPLAEADAGGARAAPGALDFRLFK